MKVIMETKLIQCSPSNPQYFKTGYPAKHAWDIPAQCGGTYKEVKNSGTYFFEAFPKQGFIRSDSKISMEDAERKAWEKYLKLIKCSLDHKNPENLDRKDYKNGCAFCKECGSWISSSYSGLKPTISCVKCGEFDYYTKLKNGDWCCEKCLKTVPDSELSDFYLKTRFLLISEEQPSITDQDLKEVFDHLQNNINEVFDDLQNNIN